MSIQALKNKILVPELAVDLTLFLRRNNKLFLIH